MSRLRWLVLLVHSLAFGQSIVAPSVEWTAHAGGTSNEGLEVVQALPDGGLVAGGYTWPGGGGTKDSPSFGGNDYWLVRWDLTGSKIWDRSFGGTWNDTLKSVDLTLNGGFILGGRSESGATGNKTAPGRGAGSYDYWVIRTDANGDMLWDKSFGGSFPDELEVVRATLDGGFILGGKSQSRPNEPLGNKTSPYFGNVDFWIVKLSADGTKEWDRTYGGTRHDLLSAIEPLPDGGYLLAGSSESTSGGNKTSPPFGFYDFWIVRIAANGDLLWDKSFGGSQSDGLTGIAHAPGRGFFLVGGSSSPNDGNKTELGTGLWVVRIDSNGSLLWDRILPKGSSESILTVDGTPDGGFITGGSMLRRFDSEATQVWSKAGLPTVIESTRALPNGAFIFGGTASYEGSNDFQVTRLLPEQYTLTLRTNFPGRGTISLNPAPDANGKYTGGSAVTLSAAAAKGYSFAYWSGSVFSTNIATELSMNGNKTMVANFALVSTAPVLAYNPEELSVVGGDFIREAGLEIWNSGGGTLNYSLTSDVRWIVIDPAHGNSVGETNRHRVTFDIAGAGPGVHRAHVLVLAEDSVPAAAVDITLRVNSPRVPAVQWQRVFDSSGDVGAFSIVETWDRGFLVGCSSDSTNGANRTPPYFGRSDFWIVRLDAQGNRLWDRSYGGTNDENLFAMQQTSDGGFTLAGWTRSDASGNKGTSALGGIDYWLVRIDSDGEKLWDATFGGVRDEYLNAMAVAPDGSILLAGESLSSPGGNKTSAYFGSGDMWVVRIDPVGNKLWDASYGGSSADMAYGVELMGDGSFVAAGGSLSLPGTGNKMSPRLGGMDFWMLRADANGQNIWDRSFGGTNSDVAFSTAVSPDGFLIGGRGYSGGGTRTARVYGAGDYWVIRTDQNGHALWDRSFGTENYDELFSVARVGDRGWLLGGTAASGTRANKASQGVGGADFWVVRLDSAGNKLWDESFGTVDQDTLRAIRTTQDGGFVMAGFLQLTNSDFKALVVKVAPELPLLRTPSQSHDDVVTRGFILSILGQSNSVYVTEYSEDLAQWHPFQTNTAPDIEFQVSDSVTTAPMRFYRARIRP